MTIRRTAEFAKWLKELRDAQARFKIVNRLDRLDAGNPGTSRSVGGGVVELKIDHGPGYRVYYIQRGTTLTVILCGGDKSTRGHDIRRAKLLAANLPDER